MQFIRDLYAAGPPSSAPVLSCEFFAPKTAGGETAFFEQTLPALARLRPGYCSVTYGAGGSTREKTFGMVERIQREFHIPTMAHLTCVGSTRAEIESIVTDARRRGVRNLLALRGDPPAGADRFVPPADGFRYAYELVEWLRDFGGFSVGVAGFPEGHLECREGKFVDWARLRDKINCGADFVISQLFFDNQFFYEFRDHLAGQLGITVPIVPGIIPILSAGQIKKFVALCGATIPATLAQQIEQYAGDDDAIADIGIEFATAQCADLLRNQVPGLHFYTLNKATATTRIIQNLGLAPHECANDVPTD